MPNYIDDDTALPAQRVDRRPIPPGESETKFVTADFCNALLQFDEDARDAIQALQQGGGGGTSQELRITPEGPWYLDTLMNLDVGVYNNYAHPSMQTHTVLVVKGADNEGTHFTGIDSTGINHGDIRILWNRTPVGASDACQIVLRHEDTGSLAANRISCPGFIEYAIEPNHACILQYCEDDRWHVMGHSGWHKQSKSQSLQLYPNLELGPLSGTYNNFGPTGNTTYTTTGLGLAGGDLDFTKYSLIRVLTAAGGATLTGMIHGGSGQADPWGLGQIKILMNYGPGDLTIKPLNGASDAINQFFTPETADLVLKQYESAVFISPMGDPNPEKLWRCIATSQSNKTFPSVTTTGATTTSQLILTPSVSPSTLAKFTTPTTNLSPGTNSTIRVTTHSDGSLLDGLVPTGSGDMRTLVNVGSGPLILVDELDSTSTSGNKFLLPSSRPIIVPGRSAVMMRYDGTLGGWIVLADNGSVRGGESVLLSIATGTLAATNVNDLSPTDTTTGMPGRFAYWWKVTGAVGTVITGIKVNPAGYPTFRDGDRIMISNGGSGLVISHANSASAVGNRINCPSGSNVTLAQFGCVELIYNGGASVWNLTMKAS